MLCESESSSSTPLSALTRPENPCLLYLPHRGVSLASQVRSTRYCFGGLGRSNNAFGHRGSYMLGQRDCGGDPPLFRRGGHFLGGVHNFIFALRVLGDFL